MEYLKVADVITSTRAKIVGKSRKIIKAHGNIFKREKIKCVVIVKEREQNSDSRKTSSPKGTKI